MNIKREPFLHSLPLIPLKGSVMSFYSGYILGQAMGDKGNSGGAAAGLFGLFAFAFVVLLVGATIGSFLLPIYSVFHFARWGYDASDGVTAVLVAGIMLALVSAAYAQALLGTRKQFYRGCAFLSFVCFAVIVSLSTIDESILHDVISVATTDKLFGNAVIASLLCAISVSGGRYLLCKMVSDNRRERIVMTASRPSRWLATSKWVAWPLFLFAVLVLVVMAWRMIANHNRIYSFMEITGRSYEEGFAFIYRGDAFQNDMTLLGGMFAFTLLAAVHAVKLARGKSLYHPQ